MKNALHNAFKKAKEDALSAFMRAYIEQRDPIPDSDLDDEQPVSLHVRTTLGVCRRLERALGR